MRDWTKFVVPRYNQNTLADGRYGVLGGTSFYTTDLVSLPTYDEIRNQTNAARSLTDFALMTNADQRPEDLTAQGKPIGNYQTRTAGTTNETLYLHRDQSIGWGPVDLEAVGLGPHLTLRLPDGVRTIQDINRAIGPVREVKLKNGDSYYTLDLGEYPKTGVGAVFADFLEQTYHGGSLQDGMQCTGRLFTTNGQRYYNGDFLSRQNPEFIYQGQKYVRVMVENQTVGGQYQDGTPVLEEYIQWARVEPVTFRINNIREVLRGEARGLDLASDELILGGLPFYPNMNHSYNTMWQNSLVRAFLNSADSRELDGNPDYKSELQWDFRKSGWLYQALDLTREPTRNYTVPRSENRIVAYGLAGCVGLEQIHVPAHVTRIEEHAFDGCVNAQLYLTPNRNLSLDQDAFAGSAFKFTYLPKTGHMMILSPWDDVSLDREYHKTKFDPAIFQAYLGNRIPKLGTCIVKPAVQVLKNEPTQNHPDSQPDFCVL